MAAAGRRGGEVLPDDQELTQCGTKLAGGSYRFRNMPRTERDPPERSLSLLRGALTPHEAMTAAFGTHRKCHRDAARQTTAGTLREVGFRVEHTPRYPLSPDHVSVYWSGDWDDDVGDLFDGCFQDPYGEGG